MEVLLVGDTLSTDIVAEGLRDAGFFNIIEAEDNESALAQLEANRPELIFVEERTPQLNGLMFVQYIRTSQEYEHLPIILIAPRLTSAIEALGQRAGVNGYPHGLFTVADVPKLIDQIFPELP